jgi:YD repeat-containing protein
MTYDVDGNLKTKTNTSTGVSRTYYWNALGQLDSVSTNGVKTRYGYDGGQVRNLLQKFSGT